MRTLTSKRYTLLGFNEKGAYRGWVFNEHSPKPSGDDATFIINEAKYIDNGVVYYLCQDGTYNVASKSVDRPQAREVVYAYADE